VIAIFPDRESSLRYVCLRLVEIDEKWQTTRRYRKMPQEDQSPENDDMLLRD
jgi:putative transposase